MNIKVKRAVITGIESELAVINQNIDDLSEQLEDDGSEEDYRRISSKIRSRMAQRNEIHQRWRQAQIDLDSDFKQIIQQNK
ncbi:hypothetical protein ACPBEI_00820 [Latilactobacillus sakei]